jgi:hypothetical protein
MILQAYRPAAVRKTAAGLFFGGAKLPRAFFDRTKLPRALSPAAIHPGIVNEHVNISGGAHAEISGVHERGRCVKKAATTQNIEADRLPGRGSARRGCDDFVNCLQRKHGKSVKNKYCVHEHDRI